MSEFNKDDYLNDLPDADNLSATGQAGSFRRRCRRFCWQGVGLGQVCGCVC